MKIGIIGGGIVGTTIAASLKKCFQEKVHVSIVDDGRPYQTSQAGQGYLWSIHRCDNHEDFQKSIEAKISWFNLLDSIPGGEDLLERKGSLLIADHSSKEELLAYLDRSNDNFDGQLRYYPNASLVNNILKPSVCGLYFPGDYVCKPALIIDSLKASFSIETEIRTVEALETEAEKYDLVICSPGPWMNDLRDVGMKPIRGVLLHAFHTVDETEFESFVPMMEWGYGIPGVHFTLSNRDNLWLIGASREDVGFSLENIDEISDCMIKHGKKFLKDGVIGSISHQTIGYRPSQKQKGPPYIIEKDDKLILCYGFEGQGVLYAAHAANEVVKMINAEYLC